MMDWTKSASISPWILITVPVGVLSSMLRRLWEEDSFFAFCLRPPVAANEGIGTNAPAVS